MIICISAFIHKGSASFLKIVIKHKTKCIKLIIPKRSGSPLPGKFGAVWAHCSFESFSPSIDVNIWGIYLLK